MTTPARPAEAPVAPLEGLPAAARLALWERGAGHGSLQRDLALLEAAFPDARRDALAAMGIGRRDSALLEMYEATFGHRLEGVLDCVSCGEALEMSIDVPQLRAGQVPGAGLGPGEWVAIEAGGYEIYFRLPDSTDLITAAASDSPDVARAELAGRVLQAWRDGEPVPVDGLPPQVLGEALEAMAGYDPLTETLLCTTCPSCGSSCTALLDVGAFLWARVEANARTLLWEVDTLARAYGWSEPQILALGERRRSAYLELIQ